MACSAGTGIELPLDELACMLFRPWYSYWPLAYFAEWTVGGARDLAIKNFSVAADGLGFDFKNVSSFHAGFMAWH